MRDAREVGGGGVIGEGGGGGTPPAESGDRQHTPPGLAHPVDSDRVV